MKEKGKKIMNGKDLLDAMNHLDDGILEETRKGMNVHRRMSKRLAVSVAACFLTVAAIWAISVIPRWQQTSVSKVQTSEQETEEGSTGDESVWVSGSRVAQSCTGDMVKWITSLGVVSVDTVRQWHEMYQNKDKESEEWLNYNFFEFMEAGKINVQDTSALSADEMLFGRYIVVDESGEWAYICYYYSGLPSSMPYSPVLESLWNGDDFVLGEGSVEDLEIFLTQHEKEKEELQKDAEYVMRILEADQYGGISYDTDIDSLCVWLTDESFRTKLEGRGIVCKNVTMTLEEQYQIMYELWQMREELELVDLSRVPGADTITVTSWLGEEKFWKLMEEYRDVVSYEQYECTETKEFDYSQLLFYNSRVNDITDLDTFITFLKLQDAYVSSRTGYYEELRTALEKLKEAYPDYSYLQLYYHVAADCDYEWYLDFDEELEAFVDSLTYQKELDFLEELEFGDPEYLEVKGLLRLYKEQYPEKSYEELYKEYDCLKDVERNQYLTCEEKLFLRLCAKYNGQKEWAQKQEEEQALEKEQLMEKVRRMAGTAAVVGATVVLIVILRRRNKNEEIPKPEIQGPIPVKNLEKRRIAVLIVALCLALMPQGVYWGQPEGLGFEVAIPYFLFHSAGELQADIAGEAYVFDSGEIDTGWMPMKVIAYLYVLTVIILLIESIYLLVKKKEPDKRLECTMKILRAIAVVQFAGSLFYAKKYLSIEGDWYWMLGICVIQLFIAIGVYLGTYEDARYLPRSSRQEALRQLGYIWMFAISYAGACFQGVPLVYFEEEHSWVVGTMFLTGLFGNLEEDTVFTLLRVTGLIFIWIAIILTCGSERLRVRFNHITRKVMWWVMAAYLIWICLAGLCVVPLINKCVYFMPGIHHMILMCWSCWRLSGASERKIW